MAKPILIARADSAFLTSEQLDRLKMAMRSIENDYHVLVVSVGAPKESISFEVLNGAQYNASNLGDLTTRINGKDLIVHIENGDKGRQRGT